MLMYFLLFVGVGLAIGHFVKEQKQALVVALFIAVFWALSSRVIWGFVTLGELLLGYLIYEIFFANRVES